MPCLVIEISKPGFPRGRGHGDKPSVTGIHVERLLVGTTKCPVYLAG